MRSCAPEERGIMDPLLAPIADSSKPSRTSTPALIALLTISLLSAGVVFWLIAKPEAGDREIVEEVLSGDAAKSLGIYQSEILDATAQRDLTAVEGRRYKVLIEDESKEGAAGVAKIGGLVTFVRGARKGEVVVIELARLKRSTAEGFLVRKIRTAGAVTAESEPQEAGREPVAAALDEPVEVGRIYRGVVGEIGRKGDGIIRVRGKVVFVAGVRSGQEVDFEVVENRDTFAIGRVVGGRAATDPAAAGSDRPAQRPAEPGADEVRPGGEFDVTVTERDNRAPESNGVARIRGLVVFVPGTRPGDRVRVRITERGPRFARAEVTERLAEEKPAP
jgi:predicted RNA-binding protein with TRAM domain